MTRDDFRIWLFLAAFWLAGCVVLYTYDHVSHWLKTRRILGRRTRA